VWNRLFEFDSPVCATPCQSMTLLEIKGWLAWRRY
jgi:hypothetical protein